MGQGKFKTWWENLKARLIAAGKNIEEFLSSEEGSILSELEEIGTELEGRITEIEKKMDAVFGKKNIEELGIFSDSIEHIVAVMLEIVNERDAAKADPAKVDEPAAAPVTLRDASASQPGHA